MSFTTSFLSGICLLTLLLPRSSANASLAHGQGLFEEEDLTTLGLEELMSVNVIITSVSRKEQSLTSAAAAVHVITAEDIRRSGATNRHTRGGHLTLNWSREDEEGVNSEARISYTHSRVHTSLFEETRNSLELEFQRRQTLGTAHEFMWGLDTRLENSKTEGSGNLVFRDDCITTELIGAFAQDTISLSEELLATIGAKLEHNNATGLEFLPSARIALPLDEDSTLWSSISRVVRTPSIAERNVDYLSTIIPDMGSGFTTEVHTVGDDSFDVEELVAYEVGYRTRASERTTWDLSTFFHDYDDLQSTEMQDPVIAGPGLLRQDLTFSNEVSGQSYGAEMAIQHLMADNWQLHAAYSYMHMNLKDASPQSGLPNTAAEGTYPAQQLHLLSYYDINKDTEFDLSAFFVGVRNLLHDNEIEAADDPLGPVYAVRTGVYRKATWSF